MTVEFVSGDIFTSAAEAIVGAFEMSELTHALIYAREEGDVP